MAREIFAISLSHHLLHHDFVFLVNIAFGAFDFLVEE